jgi:hypothetical protein
VRAFFIADITNYARVLPYALNFVQIIKGQKLDASAVDGEPNLDLYQLTRFLIGTEPLSIALDGAFQLWCHPVSSSSQDGVQGNKINPIITAGVIFLLRL